MMFKPYTNLIANICRPVSRDKRTSNKYCANTLRYGNKYVISSDFKWLAHMISSSQLWTNKVDLSEGDQNDYTLACMRPLFNFYNSGGNAVRHILVATSPRPLQPGTGNHCSGTTRGKGLTGYIYTHINESALYHN